MLKTINKTKTLYLKKKLKKIIIHSILYLILSNAVTSRRDKSILYSRNAILISIYCFIITLNSNNVRFLENGIGIFGKLIHVNFITHSFILFILQLATLYRNYKYLFLLGGFYFVGILLLVGFFGKQTVLSAALDNGYEFLVLVAIIINELEGYYINNKYNSPYIIIQSNILNLEKLPPLYLGIKLALFFAGYKIIMINYFDFNLLNIWDFTIVSIPCSIITTLIINTVKGSTTMKKKIVIATAISLSFFISRYIYIGLEFKDILANMCFYSAFFTTMAYSINSENFNISILTSNISYKRNKPNLSYIGDNIRLKVNSKHNNLDINSLNKSEDFQLRNLFDIKEFFKLMPLLDNYSSYQPKEIKPTNTSHMEGLPSGDEFEDDSTESRRNKRRKLRENEAAERLKAAKQPEDDSKARAAKDAKALAYWSNLLNNKVEPKVEPKFEPKFEPKSESKTTLKTTLAEARAKLSAETGKSFDPFANQTKAEAELQFRIWTQSQAQIEAQLQAEAQAQPKADINVDKEKPKTLRDIYNDPHLNHKGCKCGGILPGENKNAYVNEHVKYMWEALLRLGDKGLNSNKDWWKSLSEISQNSNSKILEGLLEDNVDLNSKPDNPKIFNDLNAMINKLEKDKVLPESSFKHVKNGLYWAGKTYYTHIYPNEKK